MLIHLDDNLTLNIFIVYDLNHTVYNKSMVFDEQLLSKLKNFYSNYPKLYLIKNEILFEPEEAVDSLYLLLEGSIKEVEISSSGREVLVQHINTTHTIFPVSLLLSRHKSNYSIETLSDVTIIKAPAQSVLKFLEDNPDVFWGVTKSLSNQLEMLKVRVGFINETSARERVVKLVEHLAGQAGSDCIVGNNCSSSDKCIGGVVLNECFTHEDLATWVGLTRETLCRELNKLTKKNLITYNSNHNIVIRDTQKLRELSTQAD